MLVQRSRVKMGRRPADFDQMPQDLKNLLRLDDHGKNSYRDGIYRLVVYRDGRRFILSFSEEELLEYGSIGWFDRIREKIKEALKQRWKMKTTVVAEDIVNYVVYRFNNTVIQILSIIVVE